MKKILFALLLFCQGALLTAQPPFPDVDTIYGRNPTFMYPRGWADPFDSIQPRPAFGYPMDVSIDNSLHGGGVPWLVQTPEIACKYYTDRPVKIIGAAASFFIEPVNGVEQPPLDYYVDTSIDSWMEYLRIYKHGNQTGSNIMEMVREKEVYARDVTRMMRSYRAPFSATLRENIDYRFWYFDTTTRDFDRYHYPVYEVYFNKPVTLTDSFYVAITQLGRQMDTVYEGQTMRLKRHHLGLYPCILTWADSAVLDMISNLEDLDSLWWQYGLAYKDVFHISGQFVWDWRFHNHQNTMAPLGYPADTTLYWRGGMTFPFIFPIIDTTGMGLRPFGLPCGTVENFRAANIWDRNAMMVWDGASEHNRWELAVGRADEDPSGYRIYRVNSTSRVLSGLDSNVVYAARVRAECTPKTNYSDWSDTVQFCIGMSQPEGMPSVVDQFTNLAPNPASKRVAVMSSFGLKRVELYDMNGRCAMEADCAGYAAELDVSALPEGAYIAVVTTPGGTVTKRLVVTR